jgi:DNA-binding MarR family transcriptional regulator
MGLPMEERLGLDIKRAEQALMGAKAAALRPSDLTVAQYAALLALAEHPGLSSAALARVCLVTPQAMVPVLKVLIDRGLVARTPHPLHTHVVELRLAPAGAELVSVADQAAVRIEHRIADALTPNERQVLRDLIARCVEAITAMG